MPPVSDDTVDRKVTEKFGSIIPTIGSGPTRNNSAGAGPLTLTPITANSSWYSGVAAVTAQIMPRALWQSTAGDSQDSALSAAERFQVDGKLTLAHLEELGKRPEERRKGEGKHRLRKSSTSSSSSSSSTEVRKKKRKRKSRKSSSSSTSSSSSSSSEEEARKKKKAQKNADKELPKAKSDDRYYSKYPRQSHGLDSPDTTVQRNEMSLPGFSGPAQASSRGLGTVKKCQFCVNTLVLADDMEAHISRIHNNARFGCCFCSINQPDAFKHASSDDELDGQSGRKRFFDTYAEARGHLKGVHNIAAEDILDQFIVMPAATFLRQFSCLLCNQSLIGMSEDNLRAHFKKVHMTPYMPQLVKSSCRVCGFASARTDAELVGHIDTAHPRSSFWNDPNALSESASQPVVASSRPESVCEPPRIVKKDIVENILRSHKDSGKNEETESLLSSKASKKKKKKKDVTSDSSEESTESDTSEDSKKKRKRKKKSKKKKKKSKKKKVESSDTSDEDEDDDIESVDVKSVDSNKHAIDFFNAKRQRSRESERNEPRMSPERESEKEVPREKFVPFKLQSLPPPPTLKRPSVEVVDLEERMIRERIIRRESEGERSSRKSEQKRSLSKDYRSPPARRSPSVESDADKRRLSDRRYDDSDDGKRQYRNHRDDYSDYDDRRDREYDSRRHSRSRSRRDYSDDDDHDKRRVIHVRDDSEDDDRRSNRRSRWESGGGGGGDMREGFCDDCNCSIPAGKISEHFSSKLHHAKLRGKIRCFLCNKSMANARQHLEMNHQNDIFRCNVKNCMCPKFVDAKKILDHLERTHTSITQGKTTEQLVRGGFLTLPKNLEVHTCSYCNTGLAGQHIDRVFTHMMDRCGVRNPKQSDVIFSCRLCGLRRSFETQEQLQKHCLIHLESVKQARFANSGVVKRPDSPERGRRDSRDSRSGSSLDRHRRSRRRSSSSDSSDRSRSPRPPKFGCFFCSSSFESETNREHHMLEQHNNALFTCRMCGSDSRPFKAANRFDVYDHLTSEHKMDDDEDELFKAVIRPHDLRKIMCLLCGEQESLKNAQWLCKDGHEVAAELKDHLITSHKGTRVVSNSFGLRCGACTEEFDYDKEDDWTAHVRNFHNRSPVRNASPVRPPVKLCAYCSKPDSIGHAEAEHLNSTFRCKTCMADTNMYPDFSEIRRHYANEHGIRDIQSKMCDYVDVPSNLICLKCKFCRRHLHAQTMKDFEEHFRVEHPAVKSPKKHLDFICRICMQSDVNETLEDLEQHIDEEHSDILKAVASQSSDVNGKEPTSMLGDDSAAAATNRAAAADKAKSPDITTECCPM